MRLDLFRRDGGPETPCKWTSCSEIYRISADTAEFAVQSLRKWWQEMGIGQYPCAHKLYITADGGGSNGSRNRLWKTELQKFADETHLAIEVSHFPPGTSKWNKIEHRMFSQISKNWRGRPLVSLAVILDCTTIY